MELEELLTNSKSIAVHILITGKDSYAYTGVVRNAILDSDSIHVELQPGLDTTCTTARHKTSLRNKSKTQIMRTQA